MGLEFGRADYLNLLSELTYSEFDAWYKHFYENYFKTDFDKFALGQVCSTIYRSVGVDKVSIEEFYPKKSKPQTQADQLRIWESI